jgi:hypothetical protein
VAQFFAPVARPPPPWLNSSSPRPRGSTLRPGGSTLSHLAGVGQSAHCHWPWVSSRAARRRARSPARIATVVYVGVQWGGLGLARLGVDRRQHRVLCGSRAVAPAQARACSAGPSPVWRIASVTRPRLSRGCRTERGQTAGRHHCGCVLGLVGSQPEPDPWGPGQVCRTDGPGAALGGLGSAHPHQPASGLLTSGRRGANGLITSWRHRTPRRGLGRGPRPGRATRRSRTMSPCQFRSRHLAPACARSGQHGVSRLAVPALAR